MRSLALLIGSLVMLGAVSCQNTTPPGTLFATDPPGAAILLDGKDSGYVTPSMIRLGRGASHDIRLRLPGFAEERFTVHPEDRVQYVSWMYGNASTSGLTFVFFLTFWDILLPLQFDQSFSPGRIFVRLQPQGGE